MKFVMYMMCFLYIKHHADSHEIPRPMCIFPLRTAQPPSLCRQGVGKNPIEENSMIRLRLLEHILPQRRYGGKTTMATDGNGWQRMAILVVEGRITYRFAVD